MDIPLVGTKVTLTLRNCFGHIVTNKVTILSEPYHHGFRLKSGSWSLYEIPGRSATPCYKVKFRPHHKKTICVTAVDEIVDLKVGWVHDKN